MKKKAQQLYILISGVQEEERLLGWQSTALSVHLHAQCASGETHDKRDTLAKRAGKFKFKFLGGIPRDVAFGVLSGHYSLSASAITAGSFRNCPNLPNFQALLIFLTLVLFFLSTHPLSTSQNFLSCHSNPLFVSWFKVNWLCFVFFGFSFLGTSSLSPH